jgi:galactokinase
MEIDLADRLDGAPELRLVSYTFREVFGQSPARVWRVPGQVTLLADGQRELRVAVRWGAIAAVAPRPDGIIAPMRMSRPDEQVRLTVAQAAAGAGPSWAAEGLRAARDGAALLVNTDLPEGSGAGATAATHAAIRLALRDLARSGEPGDPGDPGDPAGYQPDTALLAGRLLPFDLAGAGLRLLVIDTRVRGAHLAPAAEAGRLDEAAAALEAGAISALGPMLTAAHRALDPGEEQAVAVTAALDAGALGARMTSDGPGRPALALIPAPRLAPVRSAVSAALVARGLRPARFLTISPAGGAYRAAGGAAPST